MKSLILFLTVLLLSTTTYESLAQKEYPPNIEGAKEIVYKEIDRVTLKLWVFNPVKHQASDKKPAVVFFFGGGWNGGSPTQFIKHCEYLAARGMVGIVADYRVFSRHKVQANKCVSDAKSAIRYLKINGESLGVDTAKIVVSGGSAGGHLAACTAIIENFNEESDDLSVSTIPMALILFNPVVDTGKRGYGREKMEGREFELSPVHHITPGVPTTLIMHGKDDTTVPYENVVRFDQVMKQQGNKCILVGYKSQKHGFFNYKRSPKHFRKTMKKTESFLEDNGLLRGETWLKKYCKELGKN